MAQALRIPQPQRIDWHAPKGASAFDFTLWLEKHIAAQVQLKRNSDGDLEPVRGCSLSHAIAVDVTDAEEVAHRGSFEVELPVQLTRDDDTRDYVTVTYERLLCAERVDGQWVEHFQVEVDCG